MTTTIEQACRALGTASCSCAGRGGPFCAQAEDLARLALNAHVTPAEALQREHEARDEALRWGRLFLPMVPLTAPPRMATDAPKRQRQGVLL